MKKRNRGFTLLELMVVVVIAGILLGLGVPAMGNFIRNARMTSAANDMLAALHYARSEAIKRRVAVTVCATTEPLLALPSLPACSNSTDISGMGWVVFVDPDRDGQIDITSFDDTDGDGTRFPGEVDTDGDGVPDIDLNGNGAVDPPEDITGAEEIIRRREPLHRAIEAASVSGTAVPFRVTYLDTGFADIGGANSIVMCDSRGNVPSAGELSAARGISISQTGRPLVSRNKDEITAMGDCP